MLRQLTCSVSAALPSVSVSKYSLLMSLKLHCVHLFYQMKNNNEIVLFGNQQKFIESLLLSCVA